MKIILTETVDRVGIAGSVLNVKDGFARNYLIPQKFAIMATPGNLKKVEEIKKIANEKNEKMIARFKEMAAKVAQLNATFVRRAEESGHLFGSVSEHDILSYLNENGVEAHKTHIKMEKALKTVGEYTINIHFMSDIQATLKVLVEKE